MRKLTVTIGIPAHNEQESIRDMLRHLLAQKQTSYVLERIVVMNDGSSDNTASFARSIKDERIDVIEDNKRKGKAVRINELFERTLSDIVVVLDADIILNSLNVLESLVKPFTSNAKLMLVSGKATYAKPTTFVQKIVAHGIDMWEDVKEKITSTDMYRCEGTIRAFRRDLYKELHFPSSSSDDVYPYLFAYTKGYAFYYAKDASVSYTLPATYTDYVKQTTRFLSSSTVHERNFGKDIVDTHYVVRFHHKFFTLLKFGIKKPIKTFVYLAFLARPKLRIVFGKKQTTGTWSIAESTKKHTEPLPRIIISTYDSITHPHYAGGGAHAIHQVAKELAQTYDVLIIAGAYKGSSKREFDGIRYTYVGVPFLGPRLGQLAYHFFLPWLVLWKKYDVWIESFTPPFSTSFLQLFTKKPVIGLIHMLAGSDMMRKYRLPFHLIERAGLKTYRHFIVMTETMKKKILEIHPQATVDVVGNGVTLPSLIRPIMEEKYILFLGRIEVNQKGLDLLLESYAKVSHLIPYKLVIAGSGSPKEEIRLRELIRKYNLTGRIVLPGRVCGEKKDSLYANSAFVVIPSRHETHSLVSLEAMSHKKAIITFDIEGLRWIDENAAIRVQPFDVRGFAAAILKFSHDTKMRNEMGHAGFNSIQHADWPTIAKRYKNVIESIRAPKRVHEFKNPAMIPALIQNIVENKTPCFFVSPHLDDAILSAGDLIAYLADKTKVTVISVFTEIGKAPSTLSAQAFVKQCGFEDAKTLFAARRKEDALLFEHIGVESIHAGFVDATWRTKKNPSFLSKTLGKILPEFSHLYPTHRFHVSSGKLAKEDREDLLPALTAYLKQEIANNTQCAVFAPRAIGNHVDHIIVKEACQQVAPQVILWSDYPYNLKGSSVKENSFAWNADASRKQDLIRQYQTQLRALFPEGRIPQVPEEYIFNTGTTEA